MKLFKLFPIRKQKFPKISKFVFEKKEHQNSGTLGKDTINKWIISFLSVGKRGFKSNFDLASIFLLILKRLKTGVQWRELPIGAFVPRRGLVCSFLRAQL